MGLGAREVFLQCRAHALELLRQRCQALLGIEGGVGVGLGLELLPPAIAETAGTAVDSRAPGRRPGEPASLAEVQRPHIEQVLRHTRGKKAPAARLLGIDVKTLYSKIKAYHIDV